MKLRHIGAAALAIAVLAFVGPAAHAKSTQPTISCDRFGCSDWHRPAVQKHHVRRHLSNIGAKRAAASRRPPTDANGNRYRVVTVSSAAGMITVSPEFEPKIVPLIAELKAMGFDGRVKCYASTKGRHVTRSLHFSGNACDFLPNRKQARGHNRMPTPTIMFSRQVAAAIERAGLRNGCSFRDCGHIDIGRGVAERPAWPRVLARQ